MGVEKEPIENLTELSRRMFAGELRGEGPMEVIALEDTVNTWPL
jgi:hypothetical protein